jgi:S1-C subfamily serine protease
MRKISLFSFCMILFCVTFVQGNELVNHLQEISVTVRAGSSEGSGVIVTRELRLNSKSNETKKVNFVWTAGHVVRSLRSVRTVIDSKGQEKKTVEFKPAEIVKELVENGRKVGELRMDANVVKYSDADNGQDLALLIVQKQDFVTASAKFYLGEDTVPIGTNLFHVGSLLGQAGANSMTSGIMSQIGRVLTLGSSTGKIFDQTTVTAFPGSSGGGVFFANGDHKGEYVGMLVRGAGEGFNLIVPIRRIRTWCNDVNLMWAIDDSPCPALDEIVKMNIEDSAIEANVPLSKNLVSFPFLIVDQNVFD